MSNHDSERRYSSKIILIFKLTICRLKLTEPLENASIRLRGQALPSDCLGSAFCPLCNFFNMLVNLELPHHSLKRIHDHIIVLHAHLLKAHIGMAVNCPATSRAYLSLRNKSGTRHSICWISLHYPICLLLKGSEYCT